MKNPNPEIDLPAVYIPEARMFFDKGDFRTYSNFYQQISVPILRALKLEIAVDLVLPNTCVFAKGKIGDYLIEDEYGNFSIMDPKEFKNKYRKL